MKEHCSAWPAELAWATVGPSQAPLYPFLSIVVKHGAPKASPTNS